MVFAPSCISGIIIIVADIGFVYQTFTTTYTIIDF